MWIDDKSIVHQKLKHSAIRRGFCQCFICVGDKGSADTASPYTARLSICEKYQIRGAFSCIVYRNYWSVDLYTFTTLANFGTKQGLH